MIGSAGSDGDFLKCYKIPREDRMKTLNRFLSR
jgi:hypothetical protein